MNFVRFFLLLLAATMAAKMLVFPVFAGLQIWPAQRLESTHPRFAKAWLIGFAPIVWLLNLLWLAFTVWLTRTRGMQSTPFLWPLFIFFGISGALYPHAQNGRLPNEGTGLHTVLGLVWIAFMVASFFVIRPVHR